MEEAKKTSEKIKLMRAALKNKLAKVNQEEVVQEIKI
jgi:hypothetical protein